MLKKCQFEKLLIDYIAHELPKADRAQMHQHVKTCPVCSRRHQELQVMHGLLMRRKRPAPGAELLQAYQKALQTAFKLQPPMVSLRNKLSAWADAILNAPSPSLRLAKGLAILIIGIFLGRMMFNPLEIRQNAVSEPAAPMRLLPVNLQLPRTYWENAEILLLQILNSDLNQESDLETFFICRELANKLIAQSLIADELAVTGQNERLTLFMTRVEMLAHELANANGREGMDLLKQMRHFIVDSDLMTEYRKLKEFTLISQQNI